MKTLLDWLTLLKRENFLEPFRCCLEIMGENVDDRMVGYTYIFLIGLFRTVFPNSLQVGKVHHKQVRKVHHKQVRKVHHKQV